MALGGVLLVLALVIGAAVRGHKEEPETQPAENPVVETDALLAGQAEPEESSPEEEAPEEIPEEEEPEEVPPYEAAFTQQTQQVNGEVSSQYAILIDLTENRVAAQRNADTVINPASMTKILTVLTAAEQIDEKNLDDLVEITAEMIDFSFANGCSNAGFEKGEKVTVRDLFYGTILPSGGEAAAALAIYVSGSMDSFVELMNQKAEELGLSKTAHFTNCAGLYHADHHCTVYDMAMILKAAIDNEFCREVLSAHTYTTSVTEQHPEGLLLSNWFLRRIEDKDTGGEVVCGKTGYVQQSGNCAASYGVAQSGKAYICVTADAHSGWRCIYDHVALYKQFSL